MSNQAIVKKLIAERNWGGFFDNLDANGNGKLSHREFWTYTDTNGGDEIIKALKTFDVSSGFWSH